MTTWANAPVVAQLRPLLAPGDADLLAALAEAMDDRGKRAALDAFPCWREQAPLPPRTPWPDDAGAKPRAAGWQTRAVFISSTFADMQAERGHLQDHVFPVLAERLRQRRHRLEPIDLRWGVEVGDFSPLEPLLFWEEFMAAGGDPKTVKLLGFNGGAIAACEFRIARALGARVGIVKGSGSAADAFLEDPLWHPPKEPAPLRAKEDASSPAKDEVRASALKLEDGGVEAFLAG